MSPEQRIREPRQDRSEKTMARVVSATVRLLQVKDFDEITLSEIASESATANSSIYARFKDKRAILLAVHREVREQAVEQFGYICDPERWDAIAFEAALTAIVEELLEWYRNNHNTLKAGLLLNDSTLYAEIAMANHAGAEQLARLIQDRVPQLGRLPAARAADFIFRIITATFQQIAIFDPLPPTADSLSDEELIDGLVRASLAQLSTSMGGRDELR